eukprot:1869184-Rhodomonas_salina.1
MSSRALAVAESNALAGPEGERNAAPEVRIVEREHDSERYRTKVIREAPAKKKAAYEESILMVQKAMERWETDLACLRKEHEAKHDMWGNRKVMTLLPFEANMIKRGHQIMQRHAEGRQKDSLDELVQDGSIRVREGMLVVIAEEFSDWDNFLPFIGKTGTLTRR